MFKKIFFLTKTDEMAIVMKNSFSDKIGTGKIQA